MSLVGIMKRLRRECPWDREQTHESLRPYLIEEAHEAAEAMAGTAGPKLCDELGDVLLQVIFHATIAEEGGRFTLRDVIRTLEKKLVRRHPHVFGEVRASHAAEVRRNWEEIKAKDTDAPVLDGIPVSMPALARAQRIQEKASSVGFDWERAEQVGDKVTEEQGELAAAVASGDGDRIREEFGDLFFALVNYARFLGLNAESALADANVKFIRRFGHIEKRIRERGGDIRRSLLAEMERYWEESKRPGD